MRIARTVNQQELTNLMIRFDGHKRDIDRMLAGTSGNNPYIRKMLPWKAFRNAGVLYAQALLGSKEVPKESKRDFDKAVKLFMGTARTPNDPAEWMFKNTIPILTLIRALRWPDKVEGQSESLFRAGPFLVHNNLGAEGDDLQKVKDALEGAATKIKGVGAPGLNSVLYGDVMVVGNISKSNTLAWYYENEDVIYVRLFKKVSRDELFNLIHELGHRYIHKFMPKGNWDLWRAYHNRLKNQRITVDPKELHVGDQMPFKITGIRGTPIIQKIEDGKVYFGGTGFILERKLKQWIQESEAEGQRFPTRYSATSPDEHLCDTLAMYAMGKLAEPFLSDFVAIVLEGQDPSVLKVASRFWQARR